MHLVRNWLFLFNMFIFKFYPVFIITVPCTATVLPTFPSQYTTNCRAASQLRGVVMSAVSLESLSKHNKQLRPSSVSSSPFSIVPGSGWPEVSEDPTSLSSTWVGSPSSRPALAPSWWRGSRCWRRGSPRWWSRRKLSPEWRRRSLMIDDWHSSDVIRDHDQTRYYSRSDFTWYERSRVNWKA